MMIQIGLPLFKYIVILFNLINIALSTLAFIWSGL